MRGLRPSAEISGDTVVALNQALLKHKVLFLRGQQHLDDAAQEALRSGWATRCRTRRCPRAREAATSWSLIRPTAASANSWHTDVTFAVAPPKISVLRGVVIPPWGGDTVWANTAAAYQACRRPCASWPTSCGPCTATSTTTPRIARKKTSRTRARSTTARCLPAPCMRPSTRWCACTLETRERALVLGHFVKKPVGYSST